MNLRDLVAPVPPEEFLTVYLGRRAAHLPGPGERFRGLFDWEMLDQALNCHRLPAPRLRLARDGQILPVLAYTRTVTYSLGVEQQVLDTGRLYDELRNGASLVLDSVEEFAEPVHRLVRELQGTLREHVSVNAYASWSRIPAFAPHWDNHDVVVLQITGEKEWTLHGPGRRWPLHTDVEDNPAPSTAEGDTVVLAPGDVLYVPRGCWHAVRAGRQPSLHLAVGIRRSTGHDFVRWIADRLLASDVTRQDLPRFEGPEAQSAHVAALREEVLARLTPEGMREFFAHRDGVAHARPAVALGSLGQGLTPAGERVLEPAARITWLFPRAVLSEPDEEHLVALAANGGIWRFQRDAAVVLRYLIEESDTDFAHVADAASASLDETTLTTLITDLHHRGLVRVQPAASGMSGEQVAEHRRDHYSPE